MHAIERLKFELENRKPVAYIKLIAIIIISAAALPLAVDTIITAGGKAVSALTQRNEKHPLESEKLEKREPKRAVR